MVTHKVKVRLTYRNDQPYKWQATCGCGWHSLSWSWSRKYECYVLSGDPQTWIAENGYPVGGALQNALEHVGLASPDGVWVPAFRRPTVDNCHLPV